MTTETYVKGKYNHTRYTDEDIDALLEYFQCDDLDPRPLLNGFD